MTTDLTNSTTFLKEIKSIKRISKSQFEIFLAYSPNTKKQYAVKVFPFCNNEIDHRYQNEARFLGLQHENIISFLLTKDQQRSTNSHIQNSFYSSYIVMELAPYGDLADAHVLYDDSNTILARTLFRQLVAGVEYLHQHKIAHLDLKLENILIGEDLKLKITDFDLSYVEGDKSFHGKGSRQYRAPEAAQGEIEDPFACDIYSLGIILFALFVGTLPYIEGEEICGYDLQKMLLDEDEDYWNVYGTLCGFDNQADEFKLFKKLFQLMTKKDPVERATIQEIQRSEFYNGPVLGEKEYVKLMEGLLKNKGKKY